MNIKIDTFTGYNFGNPYNHVEVKKKIRGLIEKAKKGNAWAVRELKMVWGWDWDEDEPDQFREGTKEW